MLTRVTTYPGRQRGTGRGRRECAGLPVDRFTSVEQLISTWWLAVCPLYGSVGVESVVVGAAAPDCVRRPTTTIYYECHTNTRQRSNFVIESKLPSTHHIADPSRTIAPLYSCRSRRLDRPGRRSVHRRCPGTDRTEPGQ